MRYYTAVYCHFMIPECVSLIKHMQSVELFIFQLLSHWYVCVSAHVLSHRRCCGFACVLYICMRCYIFKDTVEKVRARGREKETEE